MFTAEKRFIQRARKHPEAYVMETEHSVMEGFEYFTTEAYRNTPGAITSRFSTLKKHQGTRGLLTLGKKFIKLAPSIRKQIGNNYTAMKPYMKALDRGKTRPRTPEELVNAYPNQQLWEQLKTYAWEKHRVIIGFTELPRDLVFTGKAVPFRHALVCIQEMQKEPIEQAPELAAGIEVITVYNSLGIATNDIAQWLRKTRHITCMANHPLGGLVDTVPLGAKAGLGAIGRHGMLITKEFGPRCRISPIFLDEKLFAYTDSTEHDWIPGFCATCGSCIRSCPTAAIYTTPKPAVQQDGRTIPGRVQAYDREACFTSFAATMGCAVCIKVCPFSKNPANYDRMHTAQHTRRT